VLVTLLIPTDFFCSTLVVEGSCGAKALGASFSIIDLGSIFTAYVAFLQFSIGPLTLLPNTRLEAA